MIGIGADLVEVDRFRRALDRTPRLRERLFRPDERMYAERAVDPAQRYAARFAAKEATLKALGLGLGAMALYDIEVVRESSGRPALCLHGRAAVTAARAGVTQWQLTLTHTDRTAHATVVAL
ncbi:MAG: holo-ACP synthase [Actinomycetota bacterium]|nr:holo-ACP synthase [Actinomycetota bacterium]